MFKLFKDIFSSSPRSSKWKDVRSTHLKSQPICQACDSKNNLEVHHIKPFHLYPALELEPNNLITLCKTCHLVFGHLMDYKSWNSNVIEDSRSFNLKVKERPYYENFNTPSIQDHSNKFSIWKLFSRNT